MRVDMKYGQASIALEGDLSEIEAILAEYWKPLIDNAYPIESDEGKAVVSEGASKGSRTKRKSSKPKSSKPKAASNGDGLSNALDANDLANKIKQREDFEAINTKVLKVNGDWLNKCLLVAVVAGTKISSGDVHRVMGVLKIKSSQPTLSRALSTNGSYFLTEHGSGNTTSTEIAKENFNKYLSSSNE